MAKQYDLSHLLTLEKSTVKIGDHIFKVNDEKTNVLLLFKELSCLNDSLGVEATDVVIKKLLGEDAFEQIETFKFPIKAYMEIYYTLMATVMDEEPEVVKERFQKQFKSSSLV